MCEFDEDDGGREYMHRLANQLYREAEQAAWKRHVAEDYRRERERQNRIDRASGE